MTTQIKTVGFYSFLTKKVYQTKLARASAEARWTKKQEAIKAEKARVLAQKVREYRAASDARIAARGLAIKEALLEAQENHQDRNYYRVLALNRKKLQEKAAKVAKSCKKAENTQPA